MTTCLLNANCDTSRFLYCNATGGSPGYCVCNSSMFWNGNSISGTCEYKQTVNQYCSPYDDSWCDNTGPAGQNLICAHYTNPYGNDYGK